MTRAGELVIEGMDCPSCVQGIRARLERLPGVTEPEVLFTSGRVRFLYDPALTGPDRVAAALAEVGHHARPATAASPEPGRLEAAGPRSLWKEPRTLRTAGAGAFLALAFILGASQVPVPAQSAYAAALLLAGWDVARAAWSALRHRLTADMHVLMLAAAIGAVTLGEWSEAATILFLFGIAEALEAWSMDRARRAVASLVSAAPREASVIRAGAEQRLNVGEVQVGETIRVRPGERVPLDGEVTAGAGAVDESAVTGESVPAEKAPGDRINAGTLNGDGFLEAQVLAAAEASTLARVAALVAEAQARRSPAEQWVERFARRYTPAVLGLAVLVAIVPPVLFGASWSFWFYQALTLLIISCPCALVISTPVSMVCGLTAAARRGVLIKGGQHLERLGAARAIAFDKTGTLTRGEPQVREVVSLNGTTPEEVLRLAAALERGSEHPLAGAIVREAERLGLDAPMPEQFVSAPGIGVEGVIEGRALRVGRPTALWSALPDDLTPVLERLETAGATPVALAEVGVPASNRDGQDEQDRRTRGRGDFGLSASPRLRVAPSHPVHPVHPCELSGTPERLNAHPLGLIALADQPRPEAAGMIAALRGLGLRRLLMLTGDRERPARAVAAAVGIDEVHAELMPAEKAERLRRVEQEAGAVVMVGDGINDAPALAAASVSVAMGAAGADIALETADVALMGDDLTRLPEAIDLSRRTLRTVQANVAFSLGLKALFVLLVLLGQSSLWLAVLADTGASLAVTAYALRLLRYPGLRRAAEPARHPHAELVAAGR